MTFNLFTKCGEVVDPGAGLTDNLDVAIIRHRTPAVDRDVPA